LWVPTHNHEGARKGRPYTTWALLSSLTKIWNYSILIDKTGVIVGVPLVGTHS